jgi:preprotein translocase subunit SecF
MSKLGRLSRGETNIDFVGLRNRWFTISAVLIVISLLSLAVRQLNLGLEFEGGTLVETQNVAGLNIEAVRDALAPIGLSDSRIQFVDGGASVRVQTAPLDPEDEIALIDTIVAATESDRLDASIESVGPTFGAQVARQAVIALVVFLGFAALFITWRLQWKMAGAGLAALAHDMILTIGVYALTGFEVTPATVVALLTILGYSLYDTVVVFDRVSELEHTLDIDLTYSDLINRSMNQVIVRSLATSFTSLLPIGTLLFVGALLLGASSLQDFALALFVGIAAGTYSSIFFAAPLLAVWKEREPEWIDMRERLERRAVEKAAREAGAPVAPVRPPKGEAAPTEPRTPKKPTGATPRPPKGVGAKPRPPKGR